MTDLPEPVRRLHSTRVALVTRGRADISQAPSRMARLLCLLAGLPKPGRDVSCSVVFTPLGDGREHWAREFAGRRYTSVMRASSPPTPNPSPQGGWDYPHLIERFGPLGVFNLHFRLTPTARGLEWSLIGWDLLGVPLPAASLPRIECLESGDGARFRFDIDVVFPLIGPVIHYSGWLMADEPA